jgi:hypothetical protein
VCNGADRRTATSEIVEELGTAGAHSGVLQGYVQWHLTPESYRWVEFVASRRAWVVYVAHPQDRAQHRSSSQLLPYGVWFKTLASASQYQWADEVHADGNALTVVSSGYA